ncbi:MAG: RecX family transcriptional regulator [Bacteroidia bacterium]|nr:RecX family transcriptional regulator [Bacteroidia bacterium]
MIFIEKAKRYCAYQERTHQQLRDKLYSWGLHKTDVEKIIVQMIEEGYLNEERFAMAFASGKFRINHWGKKKIEAALRQKKISDYCIRKALNSIDDNDVSQSAFKLAEKYLSKLNEKDHRKRKYKTIAHLISKGYDAETAKKALSKLMNDDE